VLLLLSLIGSVYLLFSHWQILYAAAETNGFCSSASTSLGSTTSESACTSATYSRWSAPIAGVPAPIFAMVLLILILFFELRRSLKTEILFSLYCFLFIGTAGYLLLNFLELKKPCGFCLTAHSINLLLCLLFYLRQKELGGEKKELKAVVWFTALLVYLVSSIITGVLVESVLLPAIAKAKGWQYYLTAKSMRYEKFLLPETDLRTPNVVLGTGKKFKMTMVIDYTCIHCRDHLFQLSRTLNYLNKQAEIKFILNPLDAECNFQSGGDQKGACGFARVSLCLKDGEETKDFFQYMFEAPESALVSIDTLLKTLKFDETRTQQIVACYNSEPIKTELSRHIEFAIKNRLLGTPVTFYADKKVVGQMSMSQWIEFLNH